MPIFKLDEPLDGNRAAKLIKQIVRDGQVAWSQHALDEMKKDDLATVDCVNVMRGGAVSEPAEFEHGSWRYRIHTPRICVVVAFRSESELVVVTAWRNRR